MSRLSKLKFDLPANLVPFVGPGVKREAKLMAARATLPLPPADLVAALFVLSREDDQEIAQTAKASVSRMPENILKTVAANQKVHPLVLDFMARNLAQDSPVLSDIALNRTTDDETIMFLASLPNKELLEIIANNQIRILRHPEIVDVLSDNPLTGQAVIDRILHFIQLETSRHAQTAGAGMEVEIERIEEPQAPPPEPEAPEAEEVPAVTEGAPDEVAAVTMGEEAASAWAAMTFSEDLLRDYGEKTEAELEEIERNLYRKIQNMKVSEKIKLAMIGGKEARGLLIRDANKMVASAVIKSPRITESEIESISRNRSVSDEVIRLIANNKEWTRNYQIKVNLVNHNKTPLHVSMQFMNHLRDKDLQALSRSKNVPAPVATAAKKLLQKRQEKGKVKRPGGH